MDFQKIEYLTFDCFGTLIDWERGLLHDLKPILSSHGLNLADDAILEAYADFEARAEHGSFKIYKEILRQVMNDFSINYGLGLDAEEKRALVRGLPHWPAFHDTVQALNQLAQRFKLIILSNIDKDLIQETQKTLQAPFKDIITAEEIGSYKPSPRNFEYAAAKWHLNPGNHCHVAQSLFHDIGPAKSLGWNAVWIDRRHGASSAGATPVSSAKPDLRFTDLASFAAYACVQKS